MTFGKWLRDKRIALKLTQEEAAKRAGMTRTMWAKLEGDESGTRRDKIPLIAAAVEANLAETYERAGFSPPVEAGDADIRFAREMEPILQRAGRRRHELERILKRQAEDLLPLLTTT